MYEESKYDCSKIQAKTFKSFFYALHPDDLFSHQKGNTHRRKINDDLSYSLKKISLCKDNLILMFCIDDYLPSLFW